MSAQPKTAGAAEGRVEAATRVIAEARARCIDLGLGPREFAQLLLPEALLAMMVAGLRQEDVQAEFDRFAREEIAVWFLQVKRTAGYCDCEREALAEHSASCVRGPGSEIARSRSA